MNEDRNSPAPFAFENDMSRGQTVFGWIWLAVHVFVLPIAAGVIIQLYPDFLTEAQWELALFAVSAVALGIAMLRYWKRGFERVLERPGRTLLSALGGLAIYYALSTAVTLLLVLVASDMLEGNPNNEAVVAVAKTDYGTMKAAAVFLAPLVEETLFRGVIFGSLRKKSRIAAYFVSVLLFCLLHVWQFVAATGDWGYLIYLLQYIPAGVALAWCYERSGTIWAPIGMHMLVNALAFSILL